MKFNNNKAIYQQIVDYICAGIINKKWLQEERIPSTRDLAVTLEVNPNTVIKSYGYLVDLNIIYNQRGIGYKVANNAIEKVISYKKDIFIKQDLTELFKNMDLLSISINDLQKLYSQYQQSLSLSVVDTI